jgi:NADH:ubiquinone oxidoreductase subunit 6 (subunit J)
MHSVNDMDTVVGLTSLVLLLSVLCALVAVWVPKLIASALWLAGTSASLAVILFLLDAPYVAVIELSVGAGLVAVLFVLAVTTVGDEGLRARSRVPTWLAGGLAVLCTGLLGWLLLPNLELTNPSNPEPTRFMQAFWQQRALDVFGQLVLLFVAALGVVVLLGPAAKAPTEFKTEPSAETRGGARGHARHRAEVHA